MSKNELFCGWCQKRDGKHDPDCQEPKYEVTLEYGEAWTIRLNGYQRNNLLWLLGICGHLNNGVEVVEPFNHANTGDWLGEISNMLVRDNGEYLGPKDAPNSSVEELKKYIEIWFDTKKVVDG